MIYQYKDIKPRELTYIRIGLRCIDDALGGLPIGGAILFGAVKGWGKSTLATQAMIALDRQGIKTLFVAGEEEPGAQVNRIKRLGGTTGDNIAFYRDSRYYIEDIIQEFENGGYTMLIVDSIQKLESRTVRGKNLTREQALISLYAYSQAHPKMGVLVLSQATKTGEIRGASALAHELDIVIIGRIVDETTRALEYEKNRTGKLGTYYLMNTTLGLVDIAPVAQTMDKPGQTTQPIATKKTRAGIPGALILSLTILFLLLLIIL